MTTENTTDAMRNVCGIRLLLVVRVKEFLIEIFFSKACDLKLSLFKTETARQELKACVAPLSRDVRNCGFL
jgi:hypothetical protein